MLIAGVQRLSIREEKVGSVHHSCRIEAFAL